MDGCEVELQAIITNDFQYIDFNKFSDKEHYLEDMPLCLILKKLNNLQQEYSFSNMSSELIPLFPREETFYVNPKIPELGTRSVEVKRKQFPLTPAYAFTA